ncbi:trypsin-2-like [Belonocnema kinseyi]|uniref:trypsin-2-like n=1 Tax=Belonocnema kinseyi TaxID=2817044 RepID=UPI00143CF23D|nr:trypsin-2-like [Belonocnema kinseyi]
MKRNQRPICKMLRYVVLAFLLVKSYGSIFKLSPRLPDHRIVGGERIDIRQHPYQLSLQTTSHLCGASVISEKWAVTAGHCVGYKLRAGSNSKYNGTTYNVRRIVRHPQFSLSGIDFDVAVIEVFEKFVLGDTVRPVKLPDREISTGTLVNITGWGNTGDGINDGILRQVSVPIVDHNLCKRAYKGINQITTRMICAGLLGVGGKDSCQGDSGGPLTVNGTLYGIVSWGLGCAQPNYPGVYSNVAELRPWIKNITGI